MSRPVRRHRQITKGSGGIVAPMGQTRCQGADMDFKFMAVRIEKIERVSFALIRFPYGHLP